jgi:hypothetical protein
MMQTSKLARRALLGSGLAAVAVITAQLVPAADAQAGTGNDLAPVSAFDRIKDERARSAALFQEAGRVLTSPRCLNCHPPDNQPRQGEDMRIHQPPVQRGAGGMGVAGMRCFTCHGPANYDPARMPGNPKWLLAPIEMAWIGKSLGEICEQLKDPKRNGGKTLDEIVEHNAHDILVGYGWEPGVGRTPAPGTQAQFGALMRAWADSGAHCPKG